MLLKEGLRTSRRVTAATKVGHWDQALAPRPPRSLPSPVRFLICLLIMVALLHRLLVGSALVAHTGAQIITDDTEFYGQSPPVYPSRESSLPHTFHIHYKALRDVPLLTLNQCSRGKRFGRLERCILEGPGTRGPDDP